MTGPFITTADLGSYLRYPSGNLDQATANMAVMGACDTVLDFLQQEVFPTDTEIITDGNGTYFLTAPHFPIRSITSITEDDTVLEESEYQLNLDGSLEKLDSCWARGNHNLRIVYNYGYDEVPPTIKMAALQIAGRIYELGISTGDNTLGGQGQVLSGGGHMNEQEMMALYRFKKLIWH